MVIGLSLLRQPFAGQFAELGWKMEDLQRQVGRLAVPGR